MAQLELYNGPQVRENLSPGNRVSGEGVGSLTRARTQRDEQIEKIGDAITDPVLRVLDKEAQERATTKLSEYGKVVDGLSTKLNEYPLDNAEKAREEIDKERRKERMRVEGGITDERTRALFATKADEYDARLSSRVEQHVSEQKRKATGLALDSLFQRHQNQIVTAKTAEEREAAKRDAIGVAKQRAKFNGLTGDLADEFVKKEIGGAMLAVALTYHRNGDSAAGLDYIEESRAQGLIQDNDATRRIVADLEKGAASESAYKAASVLFSSGAPYHEVVKSVLTDDYGPVGSDTRDAARLGIDKAMAERERVRRSMLEQLQSDAEAQALRSGLHNISDATINAIAQVDPTAALKWKKGRDAALKNVASNGTPHAAATDMAAFAEGKARIAANDIRSRDELLEYVPSTTPGDFKVLEKYLEADVKVTVGEAKEAYRAATGRDPGKKENADDFNAFYSSLSGEKTLNLAQSAARWAYPAERERFISNKDVMFGSEIAAGNKEKLIPTEGEREMFASYYSEALPFAKQLGFAPTGTGTQPIDTFWREYGVEWNLWNGQVVDLPDAPYPDGASLAAFAFLKRNGYRPTVALVNRVIADMQAAMPKEQK